MPDLAVADIHKSYPTLTEPLQVLRGISLQMNRGESVAIVGPSGSGKSTLLQIIGTLDHPTTGSVTLDGTDPFALDDNDLSRFRNKNIGFVFQDHHLLPQLTALENVLVPTLAHGSSSPAEIERGHSLMKRVGLADRIDHRPAELSGGERQRVAIARALIFEPLLLLADEPTGNLDRTTANSIAELLIELPEASAIPTITIVVTHSLDLAKTMQRQVELDNGKIVEQANA